MKKAKQMVLLYFLHVHQTQSSRGNAAVYATLYDDLPLAQSTIRGIVQEFLNAQILRRVVSEDREGFVLTTKGVDVCVDSFVSLFTPSDAEATLLIRPAGSRVVHEKYLHVQLDTKTFCFFGSFNHGRADRKVLQLSISASQKVIVEFWFQLNAGRESLAVREKVAKLLQQLSRQKKSTSPNSIRAFSLQKLILLAIISALRVTEGVPEEYYPRELRISVFCTQLWRA